jgi:hypothetical protein
MENVWEGVRADDCIRTALSPARTGRFSPEFSQLSPLSDLTCLMESVVSLADCVLCNRGCGYSAGAARRPAQPSMEREGGGGGRGKKA